MVHIRYIADDRGNKITQHITCFNTKSPNFYPFTVQGSGEAQILLSDEDFVSNQTNGIEILLDSNFAIIRSLSSLMEYNSTNVSIFPMNIRVKGREKIIITQFFRFQIFSCHGTTHPSGFRQALMTTTVLKLR
jgi:hypothetical protein